METILYKTVFRDRIVEDNDVITAPAVITSIDLGVYAGNGWEKM